METTTGMTELNVSMADLPVGVTGLQSFSMSYAKIHGYLSVIVCLFGVGANLANIIVLTRKHMISSTNLILTWLAVADLLTMISYFFFALHFFIMNDPDLPPFHTRSHAWIWECIVHASFAIVCHTIAIWLTIVLAIFRYLYIWLPTKGSILCSQKRAKISIFLVYLFTVLICIPNYMVNLEQEKIQPLYRPENLRYNNSNNTSMYPPTAPTFDTGTRPSSLNISSNLTAMTMKDSEYEYIYTIQTSQNEVTNKVNYLIQAILIKMIPCVLLTILTILLVMAMHAAYKRRMRLKSQSRKDESDKHGEQNRTTGMLLAIVVLFLITELPQGVLTILNMTIDNFYQNVYMQLGDILDILALINNAINFVLYCTMSRQFRDTFVSVFCGCVPKEQQGWLKLKLITTQNGASVSNVAASKV